MKSLRTLLKIARRDLETLRRAMGEQIARQTELEDRIVGHDQAIQREQEIAQRDYESARIFGGYAAASLMRRRAMESERDIVIANADRIRALIAEAHVEVSKFERLIELEEQRARAAAEKRANEELDEFATMRAARKGQI
jgi:hypothetical protein